MRTDLIQTALVLIESGITAEAWWNLKALVTQELGSDTATRLESICIVSTVNRHVKLNLEATENSRLKNYEYVMGY